MRRLIRHENDVNIGAGQMRDTKPPLHKYDSPYSSYKGKPGVKCSEVALSDSQKRKRKYLTSL